MTKKKRLVLILGDQLDLQGSAFRGFDRETDEIFMIESAEEAQYVWTHKAKIALFLSAMRHFAQVLEADGYPLHYLKASSLSITQSLSARKADQILGVYRARRVATEAIFKSLSKRARY